jgi:mxaJ protein
MKWRRRFCLAISAASMLIGGAAADAAALRVCADPNNLPFSDQAGAVSRTRIVS